MKDYVTLADQTKWGDSPFYSLADLISQLNTFGYTKEERCVALATYNIDREFTVNNNTLFLYLNRGHTDSASLVSDVLTKIVTSICLANYPMINPTWESRASFKRKYPESKLTRDALVFSLDEADIALERDTLINPDLRLRNYYRAESDNEVLDILQKQYDGSMVQNNTVIRFLHLSHTIGNFGLIPCGAGSAGRFDPLQLKVGRYVQEEKGLLPSLSYEDFTQMNLYSPGEGKWSRGGVAYDFAKRIVLEKLDVASIWKARPAQPCYFSNLQTDNSKNDSTDNAKLDSYSLSILIRGVAIAHLLLNPESILSN